MEKKWEFAGEITFSDENDKKKKHETVLFPVDAEFVAAAIKAAMRNMPFMTNLSLDHISLCDEEEEKEVDDGDGWKG